MVVIEAEPELKCVEEKNVNHKSTTSVTRDTSDGFETASEGEVEDEDASDEDNEKQENKQEEGEEEEELIVSSKDDSYEDAMNDEELNQKALAQANDAKTQGNQLFKDGLYEDALSQYELALQLTPESPLFVEIRSICHSNRAVCFFKLEKYEDTIKECTKALELNPAYMKALVKRGEAHEKLQHFEEAIVDMKKMLELDPSNVHAKKGIIRLEPLAAEKREKMKEEMIGKLKEMGNSVLGRFGMSVDNFKAVKDPNTGSYSISFQK